MNRLMTLALVSVTSFASVAGAQPQTADMPPLDAEIEASVTALLDGYAQARYEGDAKALKAAVHPAAARRVLFDTYWGAPSDEWVRPMSYDLLDAAGGEGDPNKRPDPDAGPRSVRVFDTETQTASAMLDMDGEKELIHAVEFEGEWVIADALILRDGYAGEATEEDRAEIEQLIRDYVMGFYEIDGQKVQDTCHPILSKRSVENARGGELGFFQVITFEEIRLLGETFNTHFNFSPSSARCDIELYYVDEKHAAAKVTAASWFDYFHIAKVGGMWQIINIMFEGLPEEEWQG